MKTKISFLSLMLIISAIMFIFSSCLKDDQLQPFDSTPDIAVSDSTGDVAEPILASDFSVFENIASLNADVKYTEALESLNSGERSSAGVAIRAFRCADGGETLVVHNPASADLNFFNTREYQVYWLKAGELAGTQTRLSCICEGRYAVIVINNVTNTGVGRAFYFSPNSCNPNPDGTGTSG